MLTWNTHTHPQAVCVCVRVCLCVSLKLLFARFEHRAAAEEVRTGAALPEPPDEFVDPITASLMSDPVTLPDSGVTLDRTTVERHLMQQVREVVTQSVVLGTVEMTHTRAQMPVFRLRAVEKHVTHTRAQMPVFCLKSSGKARDTYKSTDVGVSSESSGKAYNTRLM